MELWEKCREVHKFGCSHALSKVYELCIVDVQNALKEQG
jgi:hypothetical protein